MKNHSEMSTAFVDLYYSSSRLPLYNDMLFFLAPPHMLETNFQRPPVTQGYHNNHFSNYTNNSLRVAFSSSSAARPASHSFIHSGHWVVA